MEDARLNAIITKLKTVFAERPKVCASIILFLCQSLEYRDDKPYINALYRVVHNQVVFRQVAERLADDVRRAKNDEEYRYFMRNVWSSFLNDDNSERNFRELQVKDEVLENALFPFKMIQNIRRWWNGEITGKRCVQTILECGVAMTGGVMAGTGGAILGAKIGTIFGPVGTVVGAVAGGFYSAVAGAVSVHVLSEPLLSNIFQHSPKEALRRAYSFLGVDPTAPNIVINNAYREMCIEFRRNEAMLLQLNIMMAIVKEARTPNKNHF